MVKLYIEKNGNFLNVGIEGENQIEILERFYSFWNHGATNGEFHWLIDNKLGYFISDDAKLKKSLVNSSLFRILNPNPNKYKNKRTGAISEAKIEAKEIYEKIDKENFSISDGLNNRYVYYYGTGKIENREVKSLVDQVD